MSDVDHVQGRILGSRKYGDLHPDVVRRQVERLAERYPNRKALEQAVRRRLHQAFGAYLDGNWLRKLKSGLAGLDAADAAALRRTCFDLMDLHTSTRERRPDLARVVDILGDAIPPGATVVDLACGLNALILPALFERVRFRYVGIDLHRGMIDAMADFAAAAGLEASFVWGDILAGDTPDCDVALMFKLLPILEHQEAGSAARLVADVPAETVIASFPTRSIGGADVGMVHAYQRQVEGIAGETGRGWDRHDCETELFYVLK